MKVFAWGTVPRMARLWMVVGLFTGWSGEIFAVDGWRIDERTGGIACFGAGDGRAAATSLALQYSILSRSGDVTGDEREDVVVSVERKGGVASYVCTNPKIPGLTIVKRYWPDNGGLRRELVFENANDESRYVTPFVECRFDPGFQNGLYHFGAGYIGPYKPFPKVDKPRPVNDYRQSSKGLVFLHPEGRRGNFSHYRVKIDGTVVLPWFHSTIGHYREYHDRLWYLPDGYRMGLGTFGLYKGKPVSVVEQFNCFDGDAFTFFDDVFMKDRDIAAELASIPPPAPSDSILTCLDAMQSKPCELRYLLEMLDEGDLVVFSGSWPGIQYCWGDYRLTHGFHTGGGGRSTVEELKRWVSDMKAISPRIRPTLYNMILSTSFFADIVKEHPEWYRDRDRDGNRDSNFPNLQLNWQTMFCYPECREWCANMLIDSSNGLGTDVIYVDEFQMSNTIDWQRDRVTRDDDAVKCWKRFVQLRHENGKLFFANGSGNPYADLNYMESPYELAPDRWRDWCGVGFGMNMFARLRPGQRACLLYWNGGLDYANRILALGWIPAERFNAFNSVPIMRAALQNGDMTVVNAKYAPDWKADPAAEVESHAVRSRRSGDVLLSFISRAKEKTDVPVRVDLKSLGFPAGTRVNVWRQHLDYLRAGTKREEILSDREIKAHWRSGVLAQGRIADPELLESRSAGGDFSVRLEGLAKDQMEQILVTPAPLSFFAFDDLPLSTFLSANRHGQIRGRTVTVDCKAELLLADRERTFSSVTVNGVPAATRRIRLNGGRIGTLVTVEKGTWTLGWRETPRAADAVETAELPVEPKERFTTAVAPVTYRHQPERNDVWPVTAEKDGVKVLRAGVYCSTYEDTFIYQTNLPVAVARADVTNLVLEAGTSRREAIVKYLQNFSGFELSGARQIRCRLTHTFSEAHAIRLGHAAYDSGLPGERFTGLVVDYRVGGAYTKRVSFATGLYRSDYCLKNPNWGTARQPDARFDLGEWIDEPSGRVFSLDIAKYAPEGWDGTAFVSLGASRVKIGRSLRLEFLSFNDTHATDFVTPLAPVSMSLPKPVVPRQLKKAPRSLEKIDADEWREWTELGSFIGLGGDRVKAGTRVRLAHDYEYLYIGFEMDEPGRGPVSGSLEAEDNEHVEAYVVRPDNVLYQVLADVKGNLSLYLDGKRSNATSRIVRRGEVVPGKGWRVFLALPIDDLKFNMQRASASVKFEACRVRLQPREFSTWTPLVENFSETGRYGTLNFEFK